MTILTHLPKIIAHRGASNIAPENTLRAFREARALGSNMVEFDVQLSADNVPVVIHDETVDRTTNGKGAVRAFSLTELQQLKIAKDERIPSLLEVINCLRKEDLSANIEIKPCAGTELTTVEAVLELLNTEWHGMRDLPLISSFSMEVLRLIRARDKKIMLAALFRSLPENWQVIAKELNCFSIHLDQKNITEEQVLMIKAARYQVLCYTVDELARAKTLFSWGVSGVFTNVVQAMQGI